LIDYSKKDFTESEKLEIKTEINKIRLKYPNHIPIFVYPTATSKLILNKNKFLVPKDIPISQFFYSVRQRIEKLQPEEALYYFINNTLVTNSTLIIQIYEEYKNEEGLLVISLCKENTFG
jgi:GABA(A) receptor-associated protein